MSATLTVRIDETLKERGDRVLQDEGMSASHAVRGLWRYMAQTREIPAFLAERSAEASARAKRKAALLAFAGVGEGACSHLTDEEMASLYGKRYE